MSVKKLAARLQTASSKKLKPAFEVETIQSMEDFIDPELRSAIGQLSKSDIDDLSRIASRGLLDPTIENSENYLKRLARQLEKNYPEALKKQMIHQADDYGAPFVFRGDLTGFNDAILDEEYWKTLNRQQRHAARTGKGLKIRNALEWALRHEDKISLRARQRFERLFGTGYRSLLREVAGKRVVRKVTKEDVEHYRTLTSIGTSSYKQLRNLNASRGHLFEVDHLFEQRFWNSPLVEASFDEFNESASYLVPKNPTVAALFRAAEKDAPVEFPYVHTEKTAKLRKRIPNGDEHLFSAQAIWDAHVQVFEELGCNEAFYRSPLEAMIRMYVDGSPHLTMPDFDTKTPTDFSILK